MIADQLCYTIHVNIIFSVTDQVKNHLFIILRIQDLSTEIHRQIMDYNHLLLEQIYDRHSTIVKEFVVMKIHLLSFVDVNNMFISYKYMIF